MIVSFRDDWLRDFFVEDVQSKKIPSDPESRLFRKIQMIEDATTDQDLRVPPSNHFEKPRGDLKGFHSIGVNRQWRLIFQWDGGRGEATASIWTTTAIGEVSRVDDETQAGGRRRSSDRRVHEADGPDARRFGASDGRAAEAR